MGKMFERTMLRKTLAMLIVLIVAGFEPAMAGVAFCAQSSCCAAEAGHGAPSSLDQPDCCSTVSCYEAPPADAAVSVEAKVWAAPAPALVRVASVSPRPSAPRIAVHVTSPPPTMSERLSSLSIFLI